MKITEACINHNVDRLVADATETLYEWVDDEKMIIAALGELRGIHLLAEALKEVLKS